ncbi:MULTISPECIES: hypothetical protein [Spongiibacter]|uniref:hypothetical protein n=1 Tax=Spongiibacter TaxID=630749 RepID=UPI001B28ED9B|nr:MULTISPECIES: hypothetical protein [Spongiibacter]MBO6752394.1 hypothetical protein [Spongiibacter sp.]|tara:strand:- start:3686 stop:4333 length:648 start_codon:yes stop_codon:yes gene_type:complete
MWLPDLDSLLLALCGVSLGLTLLLLLLLRRRPLGATLALLLVAPLTGGVVFLSQDLLAYRNLAEEQRVATVFVAEDPAKGFLIHVNTDDQQLALDATMHGDEWRLDARVLRWDAALGKLGLNNLVRLERLSSRYRDPADEAQQLRSVYPLQGGEWVDSWQLLRGQPFIWDWVEVDFGSGVYAPLVDGALYGVYLGRSGMFIKPENPIAINALQHW